MTSSLFSLEERVAVVTSGASGIGRSIAQGLAEARAHVGLLDLPGSNVEAAAREVEALGRRALALPHRVLVLARDQKHGVLQGSEATDEAVMHLATA